MPAKSISHAMAIHGAISIIFQVNFASATSISGIHIDIIRRNIPDVCRVWGYIITTIDDDFAATIENQEFNDLFAAGEDNILYHRYYGKKLQIHIFVLDFNTLISDAFARNKTFLDILKGEAEQ